MDAASNTGERAAALADPVRRALLAHVARSPVPVGRDEAAEAVGIPRSTAAFHLERLAAAGLLTTEFRRRSGRTGPGAGRPAKFYTAAADEVSLSVPARRYDLAAQLFGAAIAQSERTGESPRAALEACSERIGRCLGEDATSLEDLLRTTGYEPVDDGEDGLLLKNCPFRRLANQDPETICGANVALLRGAAQAADAAGRTVRFEPSDDHCCVRLVHE